MKILPPTSARNWNVFKIRLVFHDHYPIGPAVMLAGLLACVLACSLACRLACLQACLLAGLQCLLKNICWVQRIKTSKKILQLLNLQKNVNFLITTKKPVLHIYPYPLSSTRIRQIQNVVWLWICLMTTNTSKLILFSVINSKLNRIVIIT